MTVISRLNSLELQGFKTFAGKIDFVFPGDITCIVGPNGSGKSNVADAIRWVLGEQSYTLLRARRTEDMIFSGSSNRPRSGMASAIITFNNEDSWFPVDFSEVTISRRAYRDGHNEYLLNGQKILLKEINELLAQAGLTPRTYTIIGQGLVDAALSLRPDERRQFFEEAAGVTLHRARREEAKNRLSATRRNLDRVFDILNELRPRLKSLERQASRARQQDQLKADLRVLLREWYGYLWHRAQEDLFHAREVLLSQEKRLGEVNNDKDQLDQLVAEAQKELAGARENLNVWHNESANLHKNLEILNRSIAVAEERERSLNERKQDLQLDIIQSDEVLSATKNQLDGLSDEIEKITRDKIDIEQSALAAKNKMLEVEREKSILEQEFNRISSEKNNAEIEKISVTARLRELNIRAEEIITSKNVIEKELNLLDEMHRSSSGEREKFDREIEDIQRDLSQIEKKFSDSESEIEKLLEEWNHSSKQSQALQEKQIGLSAKKDVLENSIEKNELLSTGAQTFYNKVSKLKHVFPMRALSTLMEVPEEYEIAIASALGEYLDAFFLEEDSSLEESLELIAEQMLGRVVLFPSKGTKHSSNAKKIMGDRVIGSAFDVVKIKESKCTVLENLLHSIILIEGRQNAQNLVTNLTPNMCLVTLNGDVYRSDGAVISGKDQRNEIFTAQRNLRRITLDLQEINAQISIQNDLLLDLDAKLIAAKFAKDEIYKKKLERNQSLTAAQYKLRNIDFEISQVTEQRKYLGTRQKNLDKQEQEIQSKISQMNEELREIETLIDGTANLVQEYLEKLNELGLDDVQIDHNFWVTRVAVIEKTEVEAEKQLREIQDRYQKVQSQNEALKNRENSSEEELRKTGDEREKLKSNIKRINAQLAELSKKVQPSEQRIHDIEKKLRNYRIEQDRVHQKLASAERFVTQAQLDAARKNDNLIALQEKIDDDFGLVSFEYQSNITGPTPLPFAGMVDELPMVVEISSDLEDNVNRQKAQLRRLGPINPEAQEEFQSVKERYEFLTSQVDDLEKADQDLRKIIVELDELIKTEFQKTFKLVAQEFRQMFSRLFGGGTARLLLMDENNPEEAGIEIEAILPGRRKQGLAVLSGGERSLTAVALIFALLKVSPTPFCVLDEVDAALDEANVGRFGELLRELSLNTQFIVITHNRNTVQLADVLYGVTMARDSTSQVISLKLDEIDDGLVD